MCESSDKRVAIFAKDLCFSYNKSEEILSEVNVSVNNFSIYGLLGPSGCGKTTLLRCILGRIKPSRGEIQIYGSKPGSQGCGVPGARVGYMPQELSLCLFLTIEEILTYFGKIFSMNEIEIKEKSEELIKLLGLTQNKKLIQHYSGGQKRRISLACALIHSPPLLILDEPTVGTDPLFREIIWLHLQSLCKTGVTVILTTHYIEEARNANVVAFMRSGKILAEEEPNTLLDNFGSKYLEDVFLKLCHSSIEDNSNCFQNVCYENEIIDDMSEENGGKGLNSSEDILPQNISVKFTDQLRINLGRNSNCTGKYLALIHKNLKRLSRSWILLFFFIISPTLELAALLYSAGSGLSNMNLAVFNEEINSNVTDGWGQVFINSIDNQTFNIIQFDSFEEAMDSTDSGQTFAVIDINDRFSKALLLRSLYGSDTDGETLEESEISVHIDWSNQMVALQIERKLYQALLKFAEEVALKTNTNSEFIKVPLVFERPLYGTRTDSPKYYLIPGFIILTLFFSVTTAAANLFLEEEAEGILERSFVTGITALDLLLSYTLTLILVLFMQATFTLVIPIVVLPSSSARSFFLLATMVLSQGFCGLSYGLFMASLCGDLLYVVVLVIISFTLTGVVCGVFWPIENMPMILQYCGKLWPNTLAIQSLRSILYREWSLTYFDVYIGFVATYVWIFIFLITSLVIVRKRYQVQ